MSVRHFNREAFARLWNDPTVPTDRIANAMGITRAGVSWHARRMGLPSRNGRGRRYRRRDPALLTEMWLFGLSTADIAEVMGYSCGACVSRAARDLGLPGRRRGRASRRNGGWEEAKTLQEFYEAQAGRKMAALAAEERAERRRAG